MPDWDGIEDAARFVLGDVLYPEEKPYRRNAVRCNRCGVVVESRHRHDMKYCECRDVAVDGGLDYLKRVFTDSADWEELSEAEATQHDETGVDS